ncbi:MAG TPA: FG-GAP-like repeat-containing protein [Ornithinibacter sp.]|nr:FG-GAP-like repeat-containing protein [Ornithinibacter sp.]
MSGRVVSRIVAVAAVAIVVATGMPAVTAATDTTPPVLHSVSLSRTSAVPGDTVTATIDATDDVGVARSEVRLVEGTSRRTSYAAGESTPLTADFVVTTSWANGTHQVHSLRIEDAAGNFAVYLLDGRYSSSPSSATTTHDVDLTGPSVTVSGASDRTPPQLTSFARTSMAASAGEPSTYSYSVTDVPGDPETVQVNWRSPVSNRFAQSDLSVASAGTGTVTAVLPHAGPWLLSSIEVGDGKGNYAAYQPTGTVLFVGGGRATHDLDLSSLGLQVAPAKQQIRVVPRPGRLTLVRVAGERSDDTVLAGYRVTLQPAGEVREVSMAALSTGILDLAGLPNGVNQTVTLVARSQWGDSPAASASGRPVLSGNVTGIADVTGDGRSDVVAQRQYGVAQDTTVMAYAGSDAGGLRGPTAQFAADQGGCDELGATSLSIYGGGQILCQHDDLWAKWLFGGNVMLGSRGWRTMRWVDGGYTLNADSHADVVAVNPEGELLLYPMTSRGTLLAATRIGTGWGSMISVVSAGDLSGDRRNDIAAVDASGRLWLYPGNGRGGVTARRQIGSGWQHMGALLPLRDLSGDGKADLGGITMGGELRLYRGTGTGGVRAGVVIGTGWQRYL